MSARLTGYFANKLLDRWFRGVAYVYPTTYYLGLLNLCSPDGLSYTETTYSGYARVAVPASSSTWSGTDSTPGVSASSGADGTVRTLSSYSFASTGSTTEDIRAIGLFDAPTSGNLLVSLEMPIAIPIRPTSPFRPFVPVGGISFRLDN